MAAGAFMYALVRFIEAYGLWNARVWAEWFAILSGCLYLPWEIYEIMAHASPIRWVIFTGNMAILLYLVYGRIRAMRRGRAEMDSLDDAV